MGFMTWSYYNPAKAAEIGPQEEIWTQYDARDHKYESKPGDKPTKYRVAWGRNAEWESIISENMKALIDFNCLMTPQEKKIKLEIKKGILGALLEKAVISSDLTNLKVASSLATALILTRKLLTFDSSKPLIYNKANVAHTLSKFKSGTKIFKILSDLLRSIHPLSHAAHILSPLLIPLVDSMTHCNLQQKKPEREIILEMEQEQQDPPEDQEQLHQDSDEGGDIYFFGLGPLGDNSEDPEGEGANGQDAESDGPEGEGQPDDNGAAEEDFAGEAFAGEEENDTESENVSLDDLIEELRYEEEGESDSEEDNGNPDQEMGDDNSHSHSNSEEGSDSEGEGGDEDLNILYGNEAFELEIDNEDDMGELFPENMDENELGDEFEMEFLDMNQEMMQHLRNIRRPRHHAESNDEDDDELIEIDDGGPGGYRRIMDMVNRFGGRDGNRRNPFLGGREGNPFGVPDLFERHGRGPGLHGGRGNRREGERRHGNELDSFFQVINQNQNDHEVSYWAPPADENDEGENNRYRLAEGRRFDGMMGDRFSHHGFAREFERIRAQIDELHEYGSRLGMMNQNRRRDEEGGEARESPATTNPFNIVRALRQDTRPTAELLEGGCDTKVTENKPSKEEIEQFEKEKERQREKEKEESLLKQKAEMEKQKEQLLQSKKELEKQMEELKAAEGSQMEGMQSMNLRRQSEENDQNAHQEEQNNTQNPPNERENADGASQDAPMQPSNSENQPENASQNDQINEDNKEEDMQVDRSDQQPAVEEEKKAGQQPENPEPQNTEAANESNQPPAQEVPSNVDPRVAIMIQSFSLTPDQVRNEGIDLEVLGFLPEEEVASILSAIEVVPQDAVQLQAEVNQPEQVAESPPADVQQDQPAEEVKQAVVEPVPDSNDEPRQVESQQNENVEAEPPQQQVEQPAQNIPQEVNPPAQESQINTPASQPLPQVQENLSNDQLLQDFMSGLERRQSDLVLNPGASIPAAQAQNIENDITRVLEQTLRNAGPPPANMFQAMGGMNFGMPSMPQMPQVPPVPSRQNAGAPLAPFAPPPPPVQIPGGSPAQNPPLVPGGAPPIGSGNEEEKREEAKNGNAAPLLPEGIDPEFFNSLPEEYKQELLADANLLRRNLGQPPAEPEPPQRQPDPMDTASFLASLTDQSLRREILITMDEQTLQTLPEHIQVEGRRYQRELQRRHQRREANPERMFRRMLNRADREQEPHRPRDQREENENFVDILCRREAKLTQDHSESSDISANTIKHVFTDDKNLRNLLRIIMVASQKRNHIDFKALAAPIENLCKNPVIRSKINQCFMLLLKYYKDFLAYFQQSFGRRPESTVESVFPPVYIPNQETKNLEEIHHPKIALLIFKLFSYMTTRAYGENEEIRIAFYSKEKKQSYNQVQGWFNP